MKKFLAALLIAGDLFLTSVAQAEIKTYEGVGEYLMSDFETFDVAQQRAKKRAEQNACEQAGVYVESRTEVRNAQVTKDEIITMTSGILKILDIQYKREIINDNTTLIRATVKAKINSEDITKWLAKSVQERTILVEQNDILRQANAEQDKQITELKKQLAELKIQQDREQLNKGVVDEDKKFKDFINAFNPLEVPQKLLKEKHYERKGFYIKQGIAEIRYGENKKFSKVSLAVRTYKRSESEKFRDISGVTGVQWRIDNFSTSTPVYFAKISETKWVAAWSVGHYTFSAQAENLSLISFHSLVVDCLVELSTRYYPD